jgi:hypothetical protein
MKAKRKFMAPTLEEDAAPEEKLEQRIKQLHAEIDAITTAYVDEVKTRCEQVPWGILKQTVIGRAGGCRCREYKIIHDRIEADKAIEAAHRVEKADV